MILDESFCLQNEENFLKKFSLMDIKFLSRRKVFIFFVILFLFLLVNFSDFLIFDESFVFLIICKVNFVKSLNNLVLNFLSKVEFVR